MECEKTEKEQELIKYLEDFGFSQRESLRVVQNSKALAEDGGMDAEHAKNLAIGVLLCNRFMPPIMSDEMQGLRQQLPGLFCLEDPETIAKLRQHFEQNPEELEEFCDTLLSVPEAIESTLKVMRCILSSASASEPDNLAKIDAAADSFLCISYFYMVSEGVLLPTLKELKNRVGDILRKLRSLHQKLEEARLRLPENLRKCPQTTQADELQAIEEAESVLNKLYDECRVPPLSDKDKDTRLNFVIFLFDKYLQDVFFIGTRKERLPLIANLLTACGFREEICFEKANEDNTNTITQYVLVWNEERQRFSVLEKSVSTSRPPSSFRCDSFELEEPRCYSLDESKNYCKRVVERIDKRMKRAKHMKPWIDAWFDEFVTL